jgi:N-acetylneuraminic acid mutarotase
MPTARYGLGVGASTNGKFYAIGGWQDGGNALSANEAYDPVADTWTSKSSMPTARRYLGVTATSDGRIWAIGGEDAAYGDYGNAYATVEVYDPSTDTWTTKASMPTARRWVSVAVASNGLIYAMGGQVGVGSGTIGLNTVEAYNPATDSWTTKANLPDTMSGIGLVAAPNGKLYLVGGASGTPGAVYAYDPTTDTYSSMPGLVTPDSSLAAALATNGDIYALGGCNSSACQVADNQQATFVPACAPTSTVTATATATPTRRPTHTPTASLTPTPANAPSLTPTPTTALPDLQESAVTNPPSSAAVRSSFKVSDTVTNFGSVTATQSTTGFYLSTNPASVTGAVLLMGSRKVPGVAPASSSTGLTTVTIPAGTALGSYYLIACADYLNKVTESNETNNCRASTLEVLVTAAPTSTSSPTNTPTVTPSATPTSTPTLTPTSTSTPTFTPSDTPTIAPTPSIAQSPTNTPFLCGGKGNQIGCVTATPTSSPAVTQTPPACVSPLTWQSKALMPTARKGVGLVATADGKVYAIGGDDGNGQTVEVYDPSTDSWAERAPMPTGRGGAGTALGPDGKIYIAGGDVFSSGGFLNQMEAYDPVTDSWSEKQPMPTARTGLGLATAPNGKLYAIGGYNGSFLSTVEVFDPTTDAWSTAQSMPTAREWVGIVTAPNGLIYAVGGGSGPLLTTVEAYDPATDSWATKSPMPTARWALGLATSTSGILYAVGGNSGGGDPAGNIATVEDYNTATDSWTTDNPMLTARQGVAAAIASNVLYAVGGDVAPGIVTGANEAASIIQCGP